MRGGGEGQRSSVNRSRGLCRKVRRKGSRERISRSAAGDNRQKRLSLYSVAPSGKIILMEGTTRCSLVKKKIFTADSSRHLGKREENQQS